MTTHTLAPVSSANLGSRNNQILRAILERGGIQGSTGPGPSGYSTEGDVLVDRTVDGFLLNDIWAEFREVLRLYNEHRSAVSALFAYSTTRVMDQVAQTVGGSEFEVASEFGVPKSVRAPSDVLTLGFTFEDFDIASRFTWKFLRDADARQIQSVHERILESDNRLVTHQIMRQLLTPTPGENEHGHTVYPLWNGDAILPPSYLGRTWNTPHSHYATTQGELDSSDVEWLITTITEHGYGLEPGSQLVLLANPDEGKLIQRFRANVVAADGEVSSFDFIPSTGAPAYLTDQTIIGERPPGEFGTLKVAGSLGPAWLIESQFVPAGYVICAASGGPNSLSNPVAVRQHANPSYQGLRILPGTHQGYPLLDAYYARGFGTGVRHRGAAAVVQVTNAGVANYTAPTIR